ncbi:hypothetical protein L6R52_03850 [Myxococcota bacterium]|nr:hypothetical protein [Myxococcota bacterium]
MEAEREPDREAMKHEAEREELDVGAGLRRAHDANAVEEPMSEQPGTEHRPDERSPDTAKARPGTSDPRGQDGATEERGDRPSAGCGEAPRHDVDEQESTDGREHEPVEQRGRGAPRSRPRSEDDAAHEPERRETEGFGDLQIHMWAAINTAMQMQYDRNNSVLATAPRAP